MTTVLSLRAHMPAIGRKYRVRVQIVDCTPGTSLTFFSLSEGISPFEMEIQALEGKFKLGQERSDGDRNGVLAHLARGEYKERSLFDLTQAFYKSPPK